MGAQPRRLDSLDDELLAPIVLPAPPRIRRGRETYADEIVERIVCSS